MSNDLIGALFDCFIGHVDDLEAAPAKDLLGFLHFFIDRLRVGVWSGPRRPQLLLTAGAVLQ
jgi:hypothetical protein